LLKIDLSLPDPADPDECGLLVEAEHSEFEKPRKEGEAGAPAKSSKAGRRLASTGTLRGFDSRRLHSGSLCTA